MARRRTTHGLRRLAPGVAPGGDARASRSSTYASWANMRARCNTPGAAGYANYGGRGIKVCARWDSFENFLADMGERPKGTSLDRVNANGDYAPDNCRWATPTVQLLNRRDRISLNAREQIIGLLRKGVTQAEIAETFNVSARTVRRIWTAIQLGTPAANVPLLRGDVAANGTTAPTRTDEPKA
ncbi:MAG: helix-turn-helix domain-containing protein [Tessaracoccus sp.]|uniref:helix-turn-helix domain-containing protein n=1 Tax=Tessaracoccus sp. TaxID=1971211 RepID=UPI001EB324CC|nr:helix-turn-helix domain-containing protein [Tessaracoccus sp.]MBK7823042.1 helix-turn-helix domain-containing protein [Tessaracoccus sp.]